MSTPRVDHDLVLWTDQRIRDILDAPRMWGGCLESVEFQILTLLQVRAVLVDPAREFQAPRRILDEYVRALSERYQVSPPAPVHQFVGEEDDARFVQIMTDLAEALSDKVEPGQDDFFASAYLGLELLFKQGCSVAARTVTGFYEDFGRAARSLARFGTGRTGRVERSIEVETDFELKGIEIIPMSGPSARARITLGPPRGQKDHVSEAQVKTALGQMVEVIERADSSSERDLARFGADLSAEARTRALVQTLRVLPRRGIDEIKLGGTLIERKIPVSFRANLDRKVRSAIAADMEPVPYDTIGSIRAIDLDRGFIVLHSRQSGRVQCYLSPERSEAVTQAGVSARVIGKLYSPRESKPFVMVDDINIGDVDMLAQRGRGELSGITVRASKLGGRTHRASLRK